MNLALLSKVREFLPLFLRLEARQCKKVPTHYQSKNQRNKDETSLPFYLSSETIKKLKNDI